MSIQFVSFVRRNTLSINNHNANHLLGIFVTYVCDCDLNNLPTQLNLPTVNNKIIG